MYSGDVIALLTTAGWTVDRKVEVSGWVDQLHSEGFTVAPEAIRLLENLGGLEVRPLKTSADLFAAEVLRFDPILAASGDFDRIEYWQNRLHAKFSPIGENGEAILLLAEDGRVFSCWHDLLWLDGETIEDAMDNTLLLAKRKPILFATDSGRDPGELRQ